MPSSAYKAVASTTRLTREQMEVAEAAILGPHGHALLAFMRATFFASGHEQAPAGVAELAKRLGWTVGSNGEAPRLTMVGSRIADSAREYCHWVSDGKTLPAGVPQALVKGKRVLDVGCGWGRHLLTLRDLGAEPIGVDVEEVFLQLSGLLAKREQVDAVPVALSAGEQLPFPDASFDVVLCTRSLPYMQVAVALAEMGRVVVDGGRVIVITKTMSGLVGQILSRQGGLRNKAEAAAGLVDACSFEWLGRRIIRVRPERSTASPVYISESFLRRLQERVGLRVRKVDRRLGMFVSVRTPRHAIVSVRQGHAL